MKTEKALQEFKFIRNELEKIAALLMRGEYADFIEVAFKVGCLQNICHENALKYEDIDDAE